MNHKEVFQLFTGDAPLVVSVPHSGTFFPRDIAPLLHSKFVEVPEDTDWYVHHLYEFVKNYGATMIVAECSRYVVDLNRHPTGEQLYRDQRTQTPLLPTHSFAGEELYLAGQKPDDAEKERRRKLYFTPYYEEISKQMERLSQNYRNVLFFDAHSIRESVTSIHSERFPHFTLGNRQGQSCHPMILERASSALEHSPENRHRQVRANTPFQGGNLTRHFGRPDQGWHSLQLEMTQDLYLQAGSHRLDPSKVQGLQKTLEQLVHELLEVMKELNGQ